MLATALLLLGAGSASAATFFAAPGAGNGGCSEAVPCSLAIAVERTRPNTGDTVFVKPGTYTDANGSEDLGLSGRIVMRAGTNLVGLGRGLPRIEAHNPNAPTTLDGAPGAKIEFLEVSGVGGNVIRFQGASALGLVAETRAGGLLGGLTCNAFSAPAAPAPLNSIACLNRAEEGTALRVGTELKTPGETRTQVRGVTAVATGTGSIGIEVLGTGNATTQTLPVYRADIALAIAQGRERDVIAVSQPATAENRFSPDTRAELTSSSFVTTQAIRGGAGPATVTSPDVNENLRQRALLDGFRQRATSPTVDRGRVAADAIPALDIDRVARPVGPAPDIGADELGGPPTETSIECSPGETRTNSVATCRAIVSTESAPSPIGRVLLSSALEQSAISTPDCALTERSPTESVCNFTYAPTVAGGHQIKAEYSGFTHERSEGVAELIVIEGIETETRIACDPRPAQVGLSADCEVTVRELGGGAFPHPVEGTVSLQSVGDGLGNPGFFTPSICTLDGGEVEASCEVTYTPNEAGTGPHTLLATYRPLGVHLLSTGRTDLAVAPETRPRGETATSVSCEPPLVPRASATECRVVVVDLPARPEAPGGFVELRSNGEGELSTSRCLLEADGPQAECRFSYVPTEEGQQDLFATYTGQVTRKASQGTTALLVSEEQGPIRSQSRTSVACAPSPVQTGRDTTCTVSVNAGTSGSLLLDEPAPTGTVQIGSSGSATAPGGCDLEAGANDGEGTCSFAYVPRRADGGSHRIFATYLGDELYEASSGETTLTVFSRTVTSLTCIPSPALVADASTCRLVVSAAAPNDEPFFQDGRADAEDDPVAPTGSVGFLSAAPGAFSKNGVCELAPISPSAAACDLTYTPADKVPGNHVITAEYDGDAEFDGRRVTATVQVRANPSTADVVCTPNPAPLGTLVDCVATVVSSRADAVPTGVVEFRTNRPSGGLKGSSCELAPVPGSPNLARCQVGYDPGRAGASGTHLIDVRYGGDRVHAGDDGAVALEVDGNQPDLTVVCTPDGVRNGASSACEVIATDLKQPRRPIGGNVRFSSDRPGEFGNGVPACELQERAVGVASCSLGFFPARDEFGPHTVTVEYLGDPEHDRAQATAVVSLQRDTTSSARCVSSAGALPENTLEKDKAASCTVTVTDATGDSAPSGEVRFAGAFLDFNDPLNPACELQPTGVDRSSCEIDIRPNRAGDTALLFNYRGSDVHAVSNGQTPLQVVDRAPTRVRLDCAPRAMAVDKPSECTASVQSLAVPPAQPTGQVTLASDRDGGFDPSATCELEEDGNGAAACTLTYTPHETGLHLLEARYGGDQAHESNEGGAVFEVTEGGGDEGEDGEDEENGGEDGNPRTHPTTTSLECVPAGTGVREPTTCFARVTDEGVAPTAPEGSVSFDSDRGDRFVPVACALEPVDEATSTCSASYEPTTAGFHQLAAAYGGDGTHEPGAPAAASLFVSAARTDTVTSVLCVPAQIARGDSTTCTAAVTGSADAPAAPTGRVEFEATVAGLPEDPGCELPPSPRRGERTSACSITFTPVEVLLPAREVKASFVGDANHRASSGTTEIELISGDEAEKNPTLATLACEPTEVEVDTATRCVATVVDTGSPRRPLSGRIELAVEPAGGLSVDGCGIANTVGRATCEFTLTPSLGGTRLITATFAGDDAHRGSSAEAEVFAFEAPDAERSATSTELVCEPSEVATDAAAGCVAVVTDEGDPTAAFEGRVEFRSDQRGVFSEATCAADQAAATLTCVTAFNPRVLGLHRLEATFVGDAGHRSSSDGAEVTAVDPDEDEDGEGGGGEDDDPTTDPTTTVLECVPAGTGVREPTTCFARVTDDSANPSSPGGSVSFDSDRGDPFVPDACTLEPVDDGSADADTSTCSVSYTPTAAGVHQLTASYGGDGTHEPGAPAVRRLTVNAVRADSTTSVLCTPAELVGGDATACTATVAGLAGGPSPTGRVEFESNAAGSFPEGASCELGGRDAAATCSVAFRTDEGELGVREVGATYAGDANHRASSGTTEIELISAEEGEKNPTLATLACEPTEVEVDTASDCVATVVDTGNPPRPLSGRIELAAEPAGGLSVTGCESAGGIGRATCEFTLTPNVGGTRLVTATFAGDDAHRGSSAEAEVFAFEQPDTERSETTTRLLCEPSEVATDAAAGCTAVVTDEGNPTAPFEGAVEFRSDRPGVFSEATCAADEAAGTLTCAAAFGPRALGAHRLEATFVGDAGHRSSTDGADVTAVEPQGDGGEDGGDEEGPDAEDTTTLVCAPAAVRTSEASTCTVTVTDEDGAPTAATGRVDFSTNQTGAFASAAACDLVADGAGTASCAVLYTPTEVGSGSHRVTAVYDGDGDHERGVGRDRIAVTAADPERAATETEVVCDPARVEASQDTTCIVTVSDPAEVAPAVPTGRVEFASNRGGLFSDAATCTLVPIAGEERATCEITYTPVEVGSGDHGVFATYAGSAVHRPSQGVDRIVVDREAAPEREPTETALACAADELKTGEPTQCVATVAAATGVLSGEVRFDSNGAGELSAPECALPAGAAVATCTVTYTPTAVGAGAHRILASYSGSVSHRPSQGEDSVAVEARPEDPGPGDGPGPGGGGGSGGGVPGGGNAPGNQPKPPVAPTAPPNTAIKKMKPKKKGAKRAASKVVKYLLLSDQPGSTFQCAIDAKPFKPCRSPFKLPKLKAGKHVLQVRAVNAQGVADPTPAVLKWKVPKARR